MAITKSLRTLVKHLDNISEDEITGLNIPTLVYHLDENLAHKDAIAPLSAFYLGDQHETRTRILAASTSIHQCLPQISLEFHPAHTKPADTECAEEVAVERQARAHRRQQRTSWIESLCLACAGDLLNRDGDLKPMLRKLAAPWFTPDDEGFCESISCTSCWA
ncbi:hypothetical protein PR003_g2989 [Phytophthora rubi]|uniref:Uncharacterized protein n=1 Tax=Phytophthora rubi TaxID=129364 RepID=A0A6A4FWQ4_9STRA|nr:hypothetical protein PR002_g2798 [Phytophthora rubi]KAE9049938.1 hypothetical protein PR001_g2850 [Phytophthora rubi]KAE9355154.1 hypothetical protein PR003_g2989 [Phytophthora rubi]